MNSEQARETLANLEQLQQAVGRVCKLIRPIREEVWKLRPDAQTWQSFSLLPYDAPDDIDIAPGTDGETHIWAEWYGDEYADRIVMVFPLSYLDMSDQGIEVMEKIPLAKAQEAKAERDARKAAEAATLAGLKVKAATDRIPGFADLSRETQDAIVKEIG